ncbi:MAG: hypothetical protein KC731_12770 [Myxococcales bacterium]|nr:hypothetical protein [Myxococcales bacterium]
MAGAFGGACAAEGVGPGDGGNSSDGGSGATTSSTGGQGGSVGVGGDGTGGSSDLCGGTCSSVTPPDCHQVVCNEGAYPGPVGECVVVPVTDGATCDDGLFCTIDDTCQSGVCTGGPPNDCGIAAPECEVVTCDEDADACTTVAGNNGDPCVGSDLCIVGATCNNGTCVGGTLNDCFLQPVPDECHVSTCNPMNGMCEPVPGNEGGNCTDPNDLCTVGKTCTAGVCQGGAPKDCSNLTVGCVSGICDTNTGQCTTMAVGEGQSCNDLDACTTGEICTLGVCGSGSPVTTCSLTADGCCPSGCTDQNDFDCAFSCELYGISSSRIIYTIDKLTAATVQGATAGSTAGTTGELTQDPLTKTVYLSSTGNDNLYTVDLLTGAVTLVGPYGDSAVVMHGLEWDSSTGTLYGYSYHNGGLYTVNTNTGAATLIGTSGITSSFGNLGYDSLNDVMYLSLTGDDSLYTINRGTGAVTLVGPMNGPTNPQSLAYDASSDTLYVIDPGTDKLYTVNRNTGATTEVGVFGTQNMLGMVCYAD